MRINAKLVKRERKKRAWSQEHLARVTGLGMRTIQRIESTGLASNESVASIATVLEMNVPELLGEGPRNAQDFEVVRAIGARLPGVKDASGKRSVAIKFKGRLLACEAIDKSAEANSLMVCVSHKRRDVLLAQKPEVYYLTDHYAPYPAVLVRLSAIKRAALRDLLMESLEFMQTEAQAR